MCPRLLISSSESTTISIFEGSGAPGQDLLLAQLEWRRFFAFGRHLPFWRLEVLCCDNHASPGRFDLVLADSFDTVLK